MRALIYTNNTLRLDHNYPPPTPRPGEALIRVTMAGICNTDIEITRGYLDFQGIPGMNSWASWKQSMTPLLRKVIST